MNILVTGASRGIGYQTVKAFAADPAHKVIALSRNSSALQQLSRETPHGNIIPVAFDLASENIAEELLPLLTKDIGHLDILINNAGALVNKPFADITSTDLNHVYNVNVFAPFRLIQLLLPLMSNPALAHIINISSMGGVQGSMKFPGLSAYSSSKAAIIGLTECLAEELKATAIRINCLAIGAVQTEMLEEAFPGYKAPLTSAEMAEFIVDFSLKAHRFCHGRIFPVSLTTP